MTKYDVYDDHVIEAIHDLVASCGGDPDIFEGELVTQMIQTCLKFLREGHNTGQLKLITRSLKEMRYAYSIFNQYPHVRRISIFGSARTEEGHPDYQEALQFGELMTHDGWMCITGAGDGIMKAAMEGAEKESSFGLSIRLPFEASANTVIEGDIKLINFRYFFTRKLMFLHHADALAVFPGGFGTMDELFEVLTLMQTGKGNIIPLVMMEGREGGYWEAWQYYVKSALVERQMINPDDMHLFYIAKGPEDAKKHIQNFYSRYHSSRYVQDTLALRIHSPLEEKQIEELNETFDDLVVTGKIRQTEALAEETDHLEYPRIVFHHNRGRLGRVRMLIDKINSFKP